MKENKILLNEIIEIYRNISSENFSVGQIIASDDTYIVFRNYEESGLESGLTLISTDSIELIKFDTQYINRLKVIKSFNKNDENIINYKFESSNILLEIIELAKKTNQIIGIEICNSGTIDVLGEVISIKDSILLIKTFDDFGKYDGNAMVEMGNISSLDIGTADCMELGKLKK